MSKGSVVEELGADLILVNGKIVSVDSEETVAEAVARAFLEGTEDEKGSLEPGKLADMVVLDRNILAVEPLDIINTKVLMTIVGGEVVYERDS